MILLPGPNALLLNDASSGFGTDLIYQGTEQPSFRLEAGMRDDFSSALEKLH